MIPRVDPDLFRREVGQFKDRWYCDPLPGCELADADPDWVAPSVSLTKKASGKDWTSVSMQRAGKWISETRPVFDGQSAQEIADRLREASGAGLDLAAERGTQIHEMFEVYADGGDPHSVELGAAAMHYGDVVARILDRERPNIVLSEFVCLSRSVGYGGTADAIWEIDGEFWLVDYKSRGGRQTIYIEEGWQGGAYARADYWVAARVVDGVLVHERMEPLELAGGLILSITREDYVMRPFDLDEAFAGFCALHALWSKRHGGISTFFGKPLPNTPPTRDRWIRDRIETIKRFDLAPLLRQWPEGVPKPKQVDAYTDEQIELLLPAVQLAEAAVQAPWPESDPCPPGEPEQMELEPEPEPVPELPAEGDEMPSALEVVRHRFEQLSSTHAEWIGSVVAEAAGAGVPIRVEEQPTARRVFLARALILACERRISNHTFWSLVESVVGTVQGEVPLGEALGRMDWERASVLAGLVSMAAPAEQDLPSLETLNKKQLQQRCRDVGLPVGGTKPDLIGRLLGEQTKPNKAKDTV